MNTTLRPSRIERFWAKFRRDPNGCWAWTAALTYEGHPTFGAGPGVTNRAHRFIYELLVEPIPPGYALDHLCRNRACVNPCHLEPVTYRENALRGLPGQYKRLWQEHRIGPREGKVLPRVDWNNGHPVPIEQQAS